MKSPGPGGPTGDPDFTYTYKSGSHGLVASVTKVGTPVLKTINAWEPDRNVLHIKQNKVDNAFASHYTYSVNDLGQRESVTAGGTAFGSPVNPPHLWDWAYNERGELVAADSPIPANSRAYDFDAIGNRITSTAGSGTGAVQTSYFANTSTSDPEPGANPLNQYGRIVTGTQTAQPVHDPDGNATAWQLRRTDQSTPIDYPGTLVWNAERCDRIGSIMDCGAAAARRARHAMPRMSRQNRLVEVKDASDNTIASYKYDYLGRRIAKSVDEGDPTWFLYDNTGEGPEPGWTTRQGCPKGGAAGRGGDVNWNLIAEYDPFGNLIASSGAKKDDFAHRFSTKYLDPETGLYYYGYRYMDPATGRWMSRDPIGEMGGFNLYGFVSNRPINFIDWLGFDERRIVPGHGAPANVPAEYRDAYRAMILEKLRLGMITEEQANAIFAALENQENRHRDPDPEERVKQRREQEEREARQRALQDIAYEESRKVVQQGGNLHKICGWVYSRVANPSDESDNGRSTGCEDCKSAVNINHHFVIDDMGNTHGYPQDVIGEDMVATHHETTRHVFAILLPKNKSCREFWSCLRCKLKEDRGYSKWTKNCQIVLKSMVKECGGIYGTGKDERDEE